MFSFFCQQSLSVDLPKSERSNKAVANVKTNLSQQLRAKKLTYGSPLFIRIFKQSSELEVWLKKDEQFELFKTYKICTFSGELGPKVKEGDLQSPEGFYFVKPQQLNPWSRFHLSFNLGYPNAYDRFYRRTGSALMVHGNCVSIGCYAMTDSKIEEIYALAQAALKAGQPYFRVHAFPFRLSDNNLLKYKSNSWYPFWENLKQGYDYFERNRIPPNTQVKNGLYTFE